MAYNNDVTNVLWSQVRFNAQRGVNYQIMVDGYQNSSTHQGNIVLLVNQAVPTLNTLAIYPAVEIEVPGNLGVSYQLQSSADLVIWDNVGAPMLGAGQPIRLLDFARGISKKFYRYLRVP